MMHCVDFISDFRVFKESKRLGWDRACICTLYKKDFKRAHKEDIIFGGILDSNIQKDSKKAVERYDLVIVDGTDEEVCRLASESWDVDLIMNPEMCARPDQVDQRSSGFDNVICSFMAERDIGYLVNFKNILEAKRGHRVRILGRIIQNIRLARKYKLKVIICTQASHDMDVRAPLDICALAGLLGLSKVEAGKTVSENPSYYFRRALDRNDPNIILDGLEVVDWGGQSPRQKVRSGWY
jgi:RNase P/RNase MRP subunit p30